MNAFARWRTSIINKERKGKAVAIITTRNDRRAILSFFAWLKERKGVASPAFGLFASPRLGGAVQAWIEEKAISCQYSHIANLVGSLVSAARCTHAMLQAKAPTGTSVSAVPLNDLMRLHSQCTSEGKQQAKFSITKPPKAWLTWAECQRARVTAEHMIDGFKGDDAGEKLVLVQTAALVRLFTSLPPDRVGVYRQLKLGESLKPLGEGSYQVDLSERGAHKTAAIVSVCRRNPLHEPTLLLTQINAPTFAVWALAHYAHSRRRQSHPCARAD